MADCLIAPVKSIATDCVWPFLKPHVDYWWYFDKNIQGLKDEIENLKSQKRVIEEGRREDAKKWLEESTKKLAEARTILPDDNIPIPKFWDVISRYSMGKKAKEMADEIAKHQKNGNSYLTADPAPRAMKFVFEQWTMEFESRKSIEKDIIASLKSGKFGVIGLCGMTGVGKTIMTQRIGKTLQDENIFEEVVMVTVSQNIDKTKIMNEIAGLLNLKFYVETTPARKLHLRKRLTDTRRKLIILDDVCEKLDFEDLGIPSENNFESCKVLLTSQRSDICNGVKNKKVIDLITLKPEEAWNLFRETADICFEDGSDLCNLAKQVAEECKGLPISLVTVGATLERETDCDEWSRALTKLKDNITNVAKLVCKSVELSYDKLDTQHKMFFLLCCLFPEDYNIPVQELTWYCMGLQMFEDIISIKEATDETAILVRNLKKRYLLIGDSRDKLHVKMHDAIRDAAIRIGSKNSGLSKRFTSIKNPSDDNCNWMSVDISNGRMKVPGLPHTLLMLLKSSSIEFSDISFEGMEGRLYVLSFRSTWIGSLRLRLGSLKNLQTLCLVNCEVENISVIGQLTSLKFFSCYKCENITELPTEIKNVSGLRLLELNECPKLQRIPFGIISSLSQLEELKIRGSFSKWETEVEKGNAALTELGSLPELTCLEIEISDPNLAAQDIPHDIRFPKNLFKHSIRIGSDHNPIEQSDCRKAMILNLAGAVGKGNWILQLARETESLTLRGDGSYNIILAETENLRNLEFSECSTVKKLVDTKDGIVFLKLETLDLWSLPELEELFNLNQNVSLQNLKTIRTRNCPKLRYLFSVSAATIKLSKLEVLEIAECDKLEQVFCDEVGDNPDAIIELSNLKKLTLVNLQNFTAFCQRESIIKFSKPTEIEIAELTTEIKIANLPKLKSFFSRFRNTSG